MYAKYCGRKGLSWKTILYEEGESGTMKAGAAKISAPGAYGLLKGERGVHRLVRISPFDKAKRRHTSFCSVSVVPDVGLTGPSTVDMKIIVATNNPGKIKEYNSILRSFGYEAISLNDAGIESDPEETGNSYSENALIKAKAASEKTDLDVIADDSGIEIEALSQNGKAFPGILSGRWGVKIGGGDWHKTRLTVLDMIRLSNKPRLSKTLGKTPFAVYNLFRNEKRTCARSQAPQRD